MKEQNEARERLAEAMHSEDWLTPWDETPYQQDDSDWAKPIAYAPNEQQTYLEYTDAVIAHLWSRYDAMEFDVEMTINEFTEFVLEHLIGPRPSGEEEE